jgi:hypothetical protein
LSNAALAWKGEPLYRWIFVAQILFYFFAMVGYFFEKKRLKFKPFFVPFYFCMMNYAMYRGFDRWWRGAQSVVWDKSKRALP